MMMDFSPRASGDNKFGLGGIAGQSQAQSFDGAGAADLSNESSSPTPISNPTAMQTGPSPPLPSGGIFGGADPTPSPFDNLPTQPQPPVQQSPLPQPPQPRPPAGPQEPRLSALQQLRQRQSLQQEEPPTKPTTPPHPVTPAPVTPPTVTPPTASVDPFAEPFLVTSGNINTQRLPSEKSHADFDPTTTHPTATDTPTTVGTHTPLFTTQPFDHAPADPHFKHNSDADPSHFPGLPPVIAPFALTQSTTPEDKPKLAWKQMADKPLPPTAKLPSLQAREKTDGTLYTRARTSARPHSYASLCGGA